jgi:protein-S-isoprenylcysteine O-methyltransferase Ste14
MRRHERSGAAGGSTSVALVFLVGLIGGVVANFLLPLPIWPGIWVRAVGMVPLLLGVWLFSSARRAFRRHSTSLMPWTPSAAMVEDGPYSFSRNPVYLAFALLYLSVALLFDSAYVLVVLPAVIVLFNRFQIPREERYLQQRFGDEYSSYKARVRRWV